MKTNLNLRVSEISSIIGYNPYSDIKPIVLRLWQKADSVNYYDTILTLVDNGVIRNPLLRDEDIIKYHSEKYNLNLNTKLDHCKSADSVKELKDKKNKLLHMINNDKTISTTDKKEIKNSLSNLTQTNYGKKHENPALEMYCDLYKTNVVGHQKFLKKKIAFSDSIDWYITGKVDGIRDDNILVEVKNRVNKLFHTLKQYENSQIQIYLHMFHLNRGHLVESIKINDKREINVIEVSYQPEVWKDIKTKLKIFIDFFYHFATSSELQLFFLTKSDKEINKYYRDLLISKIE